MKDGEIICQLLNSRSQSGATYGVRFKENVSDQTLQAEMDVALDKACLTTIAVSQDGNSLSVCQGLQLMLEYFNKCGTYCHEILYVYL